MILKTLAIVFFSLSYSGLCLAQIYKYQDDQGKWHFSDKRPINANKNLASIKTIPSAKIKKNTPYVETKQANGKLAYIAHNPLLIDVQFFLTDADTHKKVTTKVLTPNSSETLFKQQNSLHKRKIKFRYVLGNPNTTPDKSAILPPFSDYKPMKISQGFNGRFSHNSTGNRYAVDIGMPVGTKITAVKSGVVIKTKDDYAYSGVTSPFFFDKANLVEILHSDGTYAVYAHLLLGGIKVNIGDKVSAGQIIGLSGNTGYSTGPHLHFVIRYNNNGESRSLPFKFSQTNQPPATPKAGEWLMPKAR